MVGRVLLPLAILLAALFTIGWIIPTVNGPYSVACGQLEPVACEQIWRQAASQEQDASLLPVTRVRVGGSVMSPMTCSDVYLERWIFATTITSDC